ncbi:MAG: ABC transporter permease [Yoonia sp.]|uniref:ABC transporter permease n=1 Tax=Yoonia sp. TaxID=2212373 RepID=UPI003EF489F2
MMVPGTLSASSLLTVFSFAAILAVAAAGQTLVIQQSGLDLSAPGVISLSAVMITLVPGGENSLTLIGVAAAVACGMVSGAVIGIAIMAFRITPIVATLAVNALLVGCVLQLTSGSSTQAVPDGIGTWAVGRTLGIPNIVYVAAVIIGAIEIVMRTTVVGRRFVAVGVSSPAANAAGVSVTTYKILAYVAAGACYAMAGVLLASYLGLPSLLIGNSYLLPTVAAVVLGGTALTGGSGSVVASAIGALFLLQMQQITVGLGAPSSVQNIAQAIIIILSVAIRGVSWRAWFGVPRQDQTAGKMSRSSSNGASKKPDAT